ncbi:hypothetical protein [Marinilactibacillus sp. Marseille-P9653]|uniref:hypothetical protein n=1 Tax=Marinilactibacillus sp. Marseille-P9653 TaxID=2866583 RepID=UPI001CE47829|nr:hypothetical protein [Marinilactibacillus sp. Marseille-P9653]
MAKATKAKLAAVNNIVNLYNASDGRIYAEIKFGKHNELIATDSEVFKYWLIYLFEHTSQGQMLSKADINTVISSVNSLGYFKGKKVNVYLRIAEVEDKIYVDLCNDKRQVLEIDKSGFRVLSESPVLFKRTEDMEELPIPKLNKNLDYLKLGDYLNVKTLDDLNMIVSFILASFRPNIPKPILNLTGEAGTGKSMNTRLIRSFIDPAKQKDLLKKEIDSNELPVAANGQYLLAFDNLSGISKEGSDLLCVVSTGGAMTKKKLYTDTDEIIIDMKKTVILNGIDDISKRQDLVSRTVFIETPKLNPSKKKPESEIWKDFNKDFPYILGSLVNAVSVGLKNKGTDNTPYARMQDYGRYIAECSEVLGWKTGYWQKIYPENQGQGIEQSINSDPFAFSLVDMMERLKQDEIFTWTGIASELLEALSKDLPSEETAYNKAWPKYNQVKSRLRRIAPLLSNRGINWEDIRSNGKNLIIVTID